MNVEIISILDISGSMSSIARPSLQGYNSFICEQKSIPGEARVSLVFFDNLVQTQYSGRPIEQVSLLDTYPIRDSTALNDALGMTITEQSRRIDAEGWADKVIVCVLTDGHENASRRYTAPQVHSMVSAKREQGWEFVFLAANQDAFATGRQYGFSQDHTYNFAASADGTSTAYASMSASTRSLRGTTF